MVNGKCHNGDYSWSTGRPGQAMGKVKAQTECRRGPPAMQQQQCVRVYVCVCIVRLITRFVGNYCYNPNEDGDNKRASSGQM